VARGAEIRLLVVHGGHEELRPFVPAEPALTV
jgi:hypothetical protein